MATVTLRSAVNRALTSTEIDANFDNLNAGKVETGTPVFTGLVTLPSQDIDMTDSSLPDIAPSLNLDFANGEQLDSRVTFGRGSAGTYYDGKSVAKAEENLLLNSVLSSATSWAGSTSVCTFNYGAIAAPDGSFTATRCQPILGTSLVEQLISGFNIGTKSIWARTVTGIGDACLLNYFGTNPQIFNLTTTWQRFTVNQLTYGSNFVFFELYDARIAAHTATDFLVWAPQAENRSSATAYTPTTTAAITNYIPVLKSAPLNTPRFDHDSRPAFYGTCTVSGSAVTLPTTFADGSSPSTINKYYTGSITISGTSYVITNYVGSTRVVTVTGSPTAGVFSLVNKNYGQSLGLLIEEARENKATYSSDFSNAAWGGTGGTRTTNAVISPDGTLNGNRLTEDTFNSTHGFVWATVPTSGIAYALSIYMKANGRTLIQFSGGGLAGQGFTCTWNIGNGTMDSNTGGKGSITPVGNGWYRCTVSFTTSNTVAFTWNIVSGGSGTYTGDGYSGIYIWGAQLEVSSFATSHIPTPSNATVTRNADLVSMTGVNFSSWYNQSEGSLCCDSTPYAVDGHILLGLGYYQYSIYSTVENGQQLTIVNNNSVQTQLDAGTYIPKSSTKVCLTYKSTDTKLILNGGTVAVSNNTITVPAVSLLTIGGLSGQPTLIFNGTIKKLTYYPKALTSSQLKGLTKP